MTDFYVQKQAVLQQVYAIASPYVRPSVTRVDQSARSPVVARVGRPCSVHPKASIRLPAAKIKR